MTTTIVNAQTATLTGRILDAKTGQVLPFATVYINNTTRGTTADQEGVYRLANVPLGNIELVASVLGYQTFRQPLRVIDARTRTIDLPLEPADVSLNQVTVTAKRSQNWVRQLRLFTKELLGSRPQARKCEILNSEVLSFKDDKGRFSATATEPLIIENKALGYRLHYNLLHFDSYRGHMNFAGTARFEELTPTSKRQQLEWQVNRQKVYQGSIQHLLACLLTGTHKQAGYIVLQSPLLGDPTNQNLPLVRIAERKLLNAQQAQALFKPGDLPFERRLITDRPLEVYYTHNYALNSPYRDSPYAYSLLLLPKQFLDMNTNGWITQGNGLDVRGYMGDDRLATLLPVDWVPSNQENLVNAIAAGKPGNSDAGLDSLMATRRRQNERTAPIVYVHTDKALYGTGDWLWFSIYALDGERQLPIVGRDGAPLEVDVIAPNGKSIQHQWLRLTDGRAASSLRLADTLQAGTYRLRVHTQHDVNEAAFERLFTVSNLKTIEAGKAIGHTEPPSDKAKESTKKKEPAATSVSPKALDVQFLPEGGRWLTGVPGRLGIKVLQPNGRGYSVAGRIFDKAETEVASFTTNAFGMGQVTLTPSAGQQYTARIQLPTQELQSVTLPAAEAEGWALTVDAVSDSARLNVHVRASGRYSQQPVYVTLQSREQLAYRQKWLLTKGEAQFSLSTATLPPGVCRLTVWDTTFRARAERLVFIPERTGVVQMRVTMSKTRYLPREQVVFGLQFRSPDGDPLDGGFWSASVTDADQLPQDTAYADMRAYLLLTNGLHGTVESPGYYLEPDHQVDLDYLLLTHGWRRLPAPTIADSTGGWTLRGRVTNKSNKPLTDKSVVVQLTQGTEKALRSATTDAQGYFRIEGLWFTDTVTVQARVLGYGDGPILTFELPNSGLSTESFTEPNWPNLTDWQATARQRQASWPEFYRDSTARQLAEVVVRATAPKQTKSVEDERASLHTNADAVLTVDENVNSFSNIFELMMGRLPGLQITPDGKGGYSIRVRGFSSFSNSTPLFIVDGVYADYEVR